MVLPWDLWLGSAVAEMLSLREAFCAREDEVVVNVRRVVGGVVFSETRVATRP